MKLKLPGPSPKTVRIICVAVTAFIIILDIYLAIDGVSRNTITQATGDQAAANKINAVVIPAFVTFLALWLPPHLFFNKKFTWRHGAGMIAGALFALVMLIGLPF